MPGTRPHLGALAGAALTLLLAACTGADSGGALDGAGAATPEGTAYAGPVGQGEGALSVLAWPGYAEDGSTDPNIDWVTPFVTATGCQVTVTTFATSEESVQVFADGGYDVVSASGDVSLRLVHAGLVQPVNVDLVPSYAEIFPDLKDRPWNSVDGITYGIPHGRGANLLLFTKAAYPTPPESWKDMWEADSPAKGRISPYDDAIYIADAAVYLMATRPDLGITNPYALDGTQFDAAVALLEQQKTLVADYWGDITEQGTALASGAVLQSQGWQVTADLANAGGEKVGAVKPVEGTTGWSDTWMVAEGTEHLDCAYKWLDHIASAAVNAQIAEYFGEAPANAKSCDLMLNRNHCTEYHATEPDYWKDVWSWTTPTETCLDGRTDTACVGYDEWVKAWSALRT